MKVITNCVGQDLNMRRVSEGENCWEIESWGGGTYPCQNELLMLTEEPAVAFGSYLCW